MAGGARQEDHAALRVEDPRDLDAAARSALAQAFLQRVRPPAEGV